MANYPTPHIDAKPGDFAKTVLMPGDPMRSQYIAENFLTDTVLVNNIRGVQGYTGYYQGNRVSVMASGMGIPSIGIYSYELFNIFGVECIIRVGSAGSMQEDVQLRDIVIAQGACTDSHYAKQYRLPGTFAPLADFGVLYHSVEIAKEMKLCYHVGNILSSDVFYWDNEKLPDIMNNTMLWKKMGVLCVEMESAALYMNAARFGKRALGIFTISDSLITNEHATSQERATTYDEMIELALKTAVRIESK